MRSFKLVLMTIIAFTALSVTTPDMALAQSKDKLWSTFIDWISNFGRNGVRTAPQTAARAAEEAAQLGRVADDAAEEAAALSGRADNIVPAETLPSGARIPQDYTDYLRDSEAGMGLFSHFSRKVEHHHFLPTVGRELEIDSVIAGMSNRQKKVTVVTGPKGVGKTQVVAGSFQRINREEVSGKLSKAVGVRLNMELPASIKLEQLQETISSIRQTIRAEEGDDTVVVFILDQARPFLASEKSKSGSVSFDSLLEVIYASSRNGGDDTHVLLDITRGQFDELRKPTQSSVLNSGRDISVVDVKKLSVTEEEQVLRMAADLLEREVLETTQKQILVNDNVIEFAQKVARQGEIEGGAQEVLRVAAFGKARRTGDGFAILVQEIDRKVDLFRRLLRTAENAEGGVQAEIIKATIGGPDGKLAEALAKREEVLRRRDIQLPDGRKVSLEDRVEELRSIPLAERTAAQRAEIVQRQAELNSLTNEDIALHISREKEGIEFEEILAIDESNKGWIDRLQNTKARVYGQDHVVDEFVVAAENAPLGDGKGPSIVAIFLGDSGSGKTYLAVVYADESDRYLVRMDGNKLTSDASIRGRMEGADPGHVGYDDPTDIGTEIGDRTRIAMHVDEMEKADPSLGTAMLQAADEGYIRSSNGVVKEITGVPITASANSLNRIGDVLDATQKAGIRLIDEMLETAYRLQTQGARFSSDVDINVLRDHLVDNFSRLSDEQLVTLRESIENVDNRIHSTDYTLDIVESMQSAGIDVLDSQVLWSFRLREIGALNESGGLNLTFIRDAIDDSFRALELREQKLILETMGDFDRAFLDRVNYIGVFNRLGDEQLGKILRQQLKAANQDPRVLDDAIAFHLGDDVQERIIEVAKASGDSGRVVRDAFKREVGYKMSSIVNSRSYMVGRRVENFTYQQGDLIEAYIKEGTDEIHFRVVPMDEVNRFIGPEGLANIQ